LKRVYKGELKQIKDLNTGDVVQNVSPKGSSYYAHLPALSYIMRVMDSHEPGLKMIQYKDPGRSFIASTTYRKLDEEVNVLTGSKRDRVLQEYEEFRKGSVPSNIIVTSGADPEIFVVDEKGIVIPAWEFLGSKKNPTIGPGYLRGKNNIYWDGFQAEFDVTADKCLGWTLDSIFYGLSGVETAAKKHNPNARLSHAAVVPIPDDMLRDAKEEHVQFGCMPSLNAYGLEGIKEDGRLTPMRFAGGHIHFGFFGSKIEPEVYKRIVKSMDMILGVACVSMFADYDAPVRRQFYGMAGEYRLPPHGLEYRVLSNAWLMHPVITNIVFDLARRAASYGLENFQNWKAKEDDVVKCIQECNVDLARSMLKENEILLSKMMDTIYAGSGAQVAKVYQTGIDSFIATPKDITKNWGTDKPGYWMTHCDGHLKNWRLAKATIALGEKV